MRAGFEPARPGFIKMHSLKIGHTHCADFGFSQMLKACPNLHHLEANRCELTDQGVKALVKEVPSLKFVDLTSIPGISLPLIEEIKAKKPDLLMR